MGGKTISDMHRPRTARAHLKDLKETPSDLKKNQLLETLLIPYPKRALPGFLGPFTALARVLALGFRRLIVGRPWVEMPKFNPQKTGRAISIATPDKSRCLLNLLQEYLIRVAGSAAPISF